MLTSKQYHDLLKAKLKRFSRSQEEWKKFLATSARMYKYGFKESVSIFAQKPNATACAEIKTWKKATNRRVIRTSEAIGLVYSTDNVNVTSIRYVFDISNTVKVNEQSKTPYFWTIDDTCEERVYNELKQAYGVTDAINLEEAIKKIVRERIAYLTKDVQSNIIKSVEGSAAEELDEFALLAVCERFASESATYAILHRCGIEYDADFSDIYNFDTVNAITAVGDIINQTSEEVLRSIEKTMKAILKEEYYERIRETARNDNESDRRRGNNIQIRQGNGNISSVLGYEGGEDRHRQVRQDEAEISQRAETDTDDVQPADDKRRAGAASADSERAVYQQSVGIRGEEQGEVRSDGRIAEQQSARMDENLQFAENDGRGTGAQRDSLRITEQETAVSSENDTVVSLSEENEITETLTGEEIQIILRYDRFLKHSKSEIAGFFLSDSNEINRAEYLKSAYDEAYTEIMVGDQRYGYHNDIHGLELWKGPSYLSMTANMHISWDCAADIVNDMINSHEYLSADELDKQADYVDIEPQKEENGEQLTFFDMDLPAVSEGYVLPVENIKSEHFDNLLRLGSIKNRNSRQTIIAYFKKPGHNAQERADFLRSQYLTQYRNEDINDTAFGIKSLDNKLSAYFSESGVTLKAGESVFSVGGKSESISWTEATDRIQKMLDEGTYAPQTVIDASTEIEAKQTANRIWELWRDQNKDSNIRLDIDDSDFPEEIEYVEDKIEGFDFPEEPEEEFEFDSDENEEYVVDDEDEIDKSMITNENKKLNIIAIVVSVVIVIGIVIAAIILTKSFGNDNNNNTVETTVEVTTTDDSSNDEKTDAVTDDSDGDNNDDANYTTTYEKSSDETTKKKVKETTKKDKATKKPKTTKAPKATPKPTEAPKATEPPATEPPATEPQVTDASADEKVE